MDIEILSDTFFSRLREAIAPENLKQWCVRTGMPLSTLTGAAQRKTIPGVPTLVDIAAHTGRSVDWLLGLQESPLIEAIRAVTVVEGHAQWSDFVLVPLYAVKASAGHGAFAPADEAVEKHLSFRRDFIKNELGLKPDALYCIQVSGVSMEPVLRHGHPALIDPNDVDVLTEGPHFLRLEGALLVKNLQRLPGGRLRIWSENQTTSAYHPIEVDWPPKEGVDLAVLGRIRWSDCIF